MGRRLRRGGPGRGPLGLDLLDDGVEALVAEERLVARGGALERGAALLAVVVEALAVLALAVLVAGVGELEVGRHVLLEVLRLELLERERGDAHADDLPADEELDVVVVVDDHLAVPRQVRVELDVLHRLARRRRHEGQQRVLPHQLGVGRLRLPRSPVPDVEGAPPGAPGLAQEGTEVVVGVVELLDHQVPRPQRAGGLEGGRQ